MRTWHWILCRAALVAWLFVLAGLLAACPKKQGLSGDPKGDLDGDGIPNAVDQCPRRPGLKSHRGCPSKATSAPSVRGKPSADNDGPPPMGNTPDADQDGTPDPIDRCPKVPGPKSNKGCPWGDRDKDGVKDHLDKCPNIPGPPSNGGCPKAAALKISRSKLQIRQRIFFKPSKASLRKYSLRVLDSVVDILQKYPKLLLRIDGHTDAREAKNAKGRLALSRRRAQVVRRYMLSKGIDALRLKIRGFGQSRPLRPNRSARSRATNRRVEFQIYRPCTTCDLDGDGIADHLDRCPKRPGAAANKGCPVMAFVKRRPGQKLSYTLRIRKKGSTIQVLSKVKGWTQTKSPWKLHLRMWSHARKRWKLRKSLKLASNRWSKSFSKSRLCRGVRGATVLQVALGWRSETRKKWAVFRWASGKKVPLFDVFQPVSHHALRLSCVPSSGRIKSTRSPKTFRPRPPPSVRQTGFQHARRPPSPQPGWSGQRPFFRQHGHPWQRKRARMGNSWAKRHHRSPNPRGQPKNARMGNSWVKRGPGGKKAEPKPRKPKRKDARMGNSW